MRNRCKDPSYHKKWAEIGKYVVKVVYLVLFPLILHHNWIRPDLATGSIMPRPDLRRNLAGQDPIYHAKTRSKDLIYQAETRSTKK